MSGQGPFDKLKNILCSAPVLRYPDFEKEFVLTTEASNVALGAILSQDGHQCCYISRTLNNPKLNYTTTEKEMLAIVWAVKKLRQYLLGRKFQILTDHQALTWLFSVKDPSSRLMLWRLKSEFDLETELPDIEIMAAPQERDLNNQEPPDKGVPKTPVVYPENPIYTPTETVIEIPTPETPSVSKILVPLDNQLYQEYYQWFKERTSNRETEKPNANGKL